MLTHEKLFKLQNTGKPGDRLGNGKGGYGLAAIKQRNGMVFVQRIKIHGEWTNMTLGRFPDEMDLPEAEADARDNLNVARYGGDPRKPKRVQTLAEVAERYVKLHTKALTDSTKRQWRRSLDGYIYDRIGQDRPIAMVTRSDVMRVIEEEWPRPIAKQNKRRLGAILGYARNHGLRPDNPCLDIRDRDIPGGEHDAENIEHVPPEDAPRVFAAIRGRSRIRPAVRLSTLFVALTACRGAEARRAEWSEFDGGLWTVPLEHTGKRRKKDGPLRIPLSRQAREVLAEARTHYRDGCLVFPNRRGSELDGNRHNELMAKVAGDARLHGWRGSFSTFCGLEGVPYEHGEAQLGHTLPAVARAYQHGDYLEHRRPLMQRWADYLTDANS